jgi:hypothetical protein
MQLREIQRAFGEAMTGGAGGALEGVLAAGAITPAERLGVYANTIFTSLAEVLAGTFEATARLVGEDFFRGMARAFSTQNMPAEPVLSRYGAGFADFIAGYAPAATLPYLPDVARLEWAWNEIYHAQDTQPLALARLQEALEAEPEGLRIRFRPCVRLLASPWPVDAILAFTMGGADGTLNLEQREETRLLARRRAAFGGGICDVFGIDARGVACGGIRRAGG